MQKSNKKEITISLNSLVKTSGIVFIGLLLSKILSYAYRVIAARYFGPEAYGLFSLALVISGWFIAIATLGLSDGILRYVALYRGQRKSEKISYLIKSSFILLSITSILTGLLMYFLAGSIAINIFHNQNLIIFLRIFSVSIPLTVLSTPLLMSIRAFERISAYSGIFNILQNVVKVLLLGLFVLMGMGVQSISWSYIAGLAAVLTISYYYARTKLPEIFVKGKIEDKKKKEIISEVMRYSWPLLFYSLLSTILYWIDSFSIGYYKDALSVGLYNAAVPIALLLTFAPELFTQLFLPMINRYNAENKKSTIEEVSKQMSKWIFAINLPVLVIILAFPGVIINLLFGQEYLVASTALRILSVSAIVSSLGVVSSGLVSMKGKSKTVLFNILLASIVNIILNSIFVPMKNIWFIDNSLGISGAAIATVISMIFFNLLFFFQAYRYTKIFPLRRKMINVLAAIVIPTALIFYVHNTTQTHSLIWIIGIGIVFCVLYIAFLFLFRGFDIHDKEIMQKIKERLSFRSESTKRFK